MGPAHGKVAHGKVAGTLSRLNHSPVATAAGGPSRWPRRGQRSSAGQVIPAEQGLDPTPRPAKPRQAPLQTHLGTVESAKAGATTDPGALRNRENRVHHRPWRAPKPRKPGSGPALARFNDEKPGPGRVGASLDAPTLLPRPAVRPRFRRSARGGLRSLARPERTSWPRGLAGTRLPRASAIFSAARRGAKSRWSVAASMPANSALA